MRATDPITTFVLVFLIGIATGILFDVLAGRSRLAGSIRDMVTGALVGVAGAFAGFFNCLLHRRPLSPGGWPAFDSLSSSMIVHVPGTPSPSTEL